VTPRRKTFTVTIERSIPAAPGEVFDAWLTPTTAGTPWNAAEKLLLDPKVDGLFYWTLKGTAHYGRFIAVDRPRRIEHTWVSPYTLGEESVVTLTFKNRGTETVMTLVHSDLPDKVSAEAHEKGWDYFLDILREQFGDGSRKCYRWEEAHPSGKQ
jgi:uncharacterized protein YndB with AHSA1/START domain